MSPNRHEQRGRRTFGPHTFNWAMQIWVTIQKRLTPTDRLTKLWRSKNGMSVRLCKQIKAKDLRVMFTWAILMPGKDRHLLDTISLTTALGTILMTKPSVWSSSPSSANPTSLSRVMTSRVQLSRTAMLSQIRTRTRTLWPPERWSLMLATLKLIWTGLNQISTSAHSKWTTHRRIKGVLSSLFKMSLISQLLLKRPQHSASTISVSASNKAVNLKRPRVESHLTSCLRLNHSYTKLASWEYRILTLSTLATAEQVVTTDRWHLSSKTGIEKNPTIASIRAAR